MNLRLIIPASLCWFSLFTFTPHAWAQDGSQPCDDRTQRAVDEKAGQVLKSGEKFTLRLHATVAVDLQPCASKADVKATVPGFDISVNDGKVAVTPTDGTSADGGADDETRTKDGEAAAGVGGITSARLGNQPGIGGVQADARYGSGQNSTIGAYSSGTSGDAYSGGNAAVTGVGNAPQYAAASVGPSPSRLGQGYRNVPAAAFGATSVGPQARAYAPTGGMDAGSAGPSRSSMRAYAPPAKSAAAFAGGAVTRSGPRPVIPSNASAPLRHAAQPSSPSAEPGSALGRAPGAAPPASGYAGATNGEIELGQAFRQADPRSGGSANASPAATARPRQGLAKDLRDQFSGSVGNQGAVGACHAFASCGLLEAASHRNHSGLSPSPADLFVKNTLETPSAYRSLSDAASTKNPLDRLGEIFWRIGNDAGNNWNRMWNAVDDSLKKSLKAAANPGIPPFLVDFAKNLPTDLPTNRGEIKLNDGKSVESDLRYALKNGVAAGPTYEAFRRNYLYLNGFMNEEETLLNDVNSMSVLDLFNYVKHPEQDPRETYLNAVLQTQSSQRISARLEGGLARQSELQAERSELREALRGSAAYQIRYGNHVDATQVASHIIGELQQGRPVILGFDVGSLGLGKSGGHAVVITGYGYVEPQGLVFDVRDSAGFIEDANDNGKNGTHYLLAKQLSTAINLTTLVNSGEPEPSGEWKAVK